MKNKLVWILGISAILVAALWSAPPTLISRNSQWPPQSGASFSYGGPYEFVSQDMPQTATDVTKRNAHILGIWLHLPTTASTSVTVSVKDKQGTPQPLPGDGTILTPGSDLVLNSPFGVLAYGGITVSASGAGLTYQVVFTN